jgi:hypothetical protein
MNDALPSPSSYLKLANAISDIKRNIPSLSLQL